MKKIIVFIVASVLVLSGFSKESSRRNFHNHFIKQPAQISNPINITTNCYFNAPFKQYLNGNYISLLLHGTPDQLNYFICHSNVNNLIYKGRITYNETDGTVDINVIYGFIQLAPIGYLYLFPINVYSDIYQFPMYYHYNSAWYGDVERESVFYSINFYGNSADITNYIEEFKTYYSVVFENKLIYLDETNVVANLIFIVQ